MKFGKAEYIKLKVSQMSLILVEGWKYLIKSNAKFNKGLLNCFRKLLLAFIY